MDRSVDKVTIIEEFFSEALLESIQDYAFSSKAAWHYDDHTSYIPSADMRRMLSNIDDAGQYTCVILLHGRNKQKELPQVATDIQTFIEQRVGGPIRIVRLKLNRQTPRSVPPDAVNSPHWDFDGSNCWAIVVYLTDGIGDTVVYNETSSTVDRTLTECMRVQPKVNRAVIMPADLIHASSPAQGNEDRIVVNIVYEVL